jgi:hypothetical protein
MKIRTSGAVRRMRLRACTMADQNPRSFSSSKMEARVVNTGCAPNKDDSRRIASEPLRSNRSLPVGRRNLQA